VESFALFTNSENHFRINYYFPANQLVLLFHTDSNGQLKQISGSFSFKNLRELLFSRGSTRKKSSDQLVLKSGI